MTDQRPQSDAAVLPPTEDIANWVASTRAEDIDADTLRWARHCLMDWFAVTIAGAGEELTGILVDEALSDDAEGRIPIVGRTETLSPSWSLLVNGSAGHALDYDDVNQALHGHPTVAILPAVLTAGAVMHKSLDDVLRAFVVGYEAGCLVGAMTGDGHYDTGWHATGTIGTFGAAAGTAWLMDLDAEKVAHALGTAATSAAGLKSMFGTMCKPLHAGRAAQSGYLAARTAARGWVARGDALECVQGFWATQAAAGEKPFPVARQDNQRFQIHDNLFKYHAACYMTHSTIEACGQIRDTHAPSLEEIDKIRVRVAAGHLRVCNIPDPETGLEIKFSLRHTAAMALSGIDTASIDNYSDAIAKRPDLIALRQKVVVEPQQVESTMVTKAEVIVEAGGAIYTNAFDVGVPASDTDVQEAKLAAKFDSLVVPLIGLEKAAALKEICLKGNPAPLDLLHAAR